ncbi:MAG: TIM barrel protein [Acidobacteria bacterium]|nr:TIM barrel protein [Acidobacteriota bacterium]
MALWTRRRLLAAAPALAATLRALDPAQLKISITTDEVDDDLAVVLQFLERFGLHWAEIRNLAGKYNTAQPAAVIRQARKQLDAAGVKLAILDTGFFKVALPDAQELAAQWKLLDKAFENADILGTKLIRVFAFNYPRDGKPDPAHYPRIYELVAQAAEKAEKAGMLFALENVGGSYVATSKQAADLLAAVKSPALGLTWDPNNAAQEGDPEPFPQGYERLDAGRIRHVHLRDYQRTPDGGAKWCGVGDGEFDHVGQIGALLKDGYKGAFSLETHFKIDDSKAKASEYSMTRLLERVRRV